MASSNPRRRAYLAPLTPEQLDRLRLPRLTPALLWEAADAMFHKYGSASSYPYQRPKENASMNTSPWNDISTTLPPFGTSVMVRNAYNYALAYCESIVDAAQRHTGVSWKESSRHIPLPFLPLQWCLTAQLPGAVRTVASNVQIDGVVLTEGQRDVVNMALHLLRDELTLSTPDDGLTDRAREEMAARVGEIVELLLRK